MTYKIHPVDCICGNVPLQTRSFNGSSWQCRVGCLVCGIMAGKGDDMPLAVSTWNRIQFALDARESE